MNSSYKTTTEFLTEHQTKFKSYIRKEVMSLIKAGVAGNFNAKYVYKFEEGDNIRISWAWNHYANGVYFCRFFVKGDRHKESLCFIEMFRIDIFIKQVERDLLLENILKK
jgi:hypothetical protein